MCGPGLPNVNYVREPVDPGLLDLLASYVERTRVSRSPEASGEEPEASRQAEERPGRGCGSSPGTSPIESARQPPDRAGCTRRSWRISSFCKRSICGAGACPFSWPGPDSDGAGAPSICELRLRTRRRFGGGGLDSPDGARCHAGDSPDRPMPGVRRSSRSNGQACHR